MKSFQLAGLFSVAFLLVPAPARTQEIYLAGPSSVARTDTSATNWTVFAPGGPEWTFTDMVLDVQLETVFFIRSWYFNLEGCVSRPENDNIWCHTHFVSLALDQQNRRLYIGTVGGEIHGCDLNGSARTLMHSGGRAILGMDVDESTLQLYWTDYMATPVEGRIFRAKILDNGFHLALAETVATGPGAIADIEVDSDGGKVYWVDSRRRLVQRANSDGSSRETIVSAMESPSAVAFDSQRHKIYWIESPQGETILWRASPDGSALEQLFRLQYEFGSLDLGPEVSVGIEPKGWDRIKLLYRPKSN